MIDNFEIDVLKWLTGQVNGLGTAHTPWILMFTTPPGEDGTGGVEVAVSGYARQNSSGKWSVPAGSPTTVTTNAEIDFGTFNGDTPGYIKALGIISASTGGTLRQVIRLQGPRKGFTASATTDTFTVAAHGFTDGTRVVFEIAPGFTVPGGITAGTTYYLRDTSTNAFKVAATLGGAAIDLSSDGYGYVMQDKSKPVFAGDPVKIPAGELSISLD